MLSGNWRRSDDRRLMLGQTVNIRLQAEGLLPVSL
jgi:hypothetical protein